MREIRDLRKEALSRPARITLFLFAVVACLMGTQAAATAGDAAIVDSTATAVESSAPETVTQDEPAEVVSEGSEAVEESAGSSDGVVDEVAEEVTEEVAKEPAEAVSEGSEAVEVSAGSSDDVVDEVAEVTEEVAEEPAEVVSEGSQAVDEATADPGTEAIEDTTETVSSVVADVDGSAEAVDEVTEQVATITEESAEVLTETVEAITDEVRVEHLVDEVTTAVEPVVAEVTEIAEPAVEAVTATADGVLPATEVDGAIGDVVESPLPAAVTTTGEDLLSVTPTAELVAGTVDDVSFGPVLQPVQPGPASTPAAVIPDPAVADQPGTTPPPDRADTRTTPAVPAPDVPGSSRASDVAEDPAAATSDTVRTSPVAASPDPQFIPEALIGERGATVPTPSPRADRPAIVPSATPSSAGGGHTFQDVLAVPSGPVVVFALLALGLLVSTRAALLPAAFACRERPG